MEGPQLPAVALPEGEVTPQWVADLAVKLDDASRAGAAHLKGVLPPDVCAHLLDRCQRLLHLEPTLLEVEPPAEGQVCVVGDTHGQFHDVCRLLEVVGSPSASNVLVFNGDFVDRGAWGLETLMLLVGWKLALPRSIFLLRGNHESATCTLMYGFKGELVAKYGKSHWRPVYAACKRLFSSLPLAARIGQHTLVLHGGLFRRQPQRSSGKNKRKRAQPLLYGLDDVTLGGLDDLRRATKGGMDPNGLGASRLASDVLWSDPVGEPGFQPNVARGVGMVFGPDVTERFLSENGLRLVLRSHEGPDAREGREDMKPMLGGYTLDHSTPSGKLMTVFSAPDYPQFMPDDAERYNNLAAVAVLTAPDWATPNMRQFAAAHPRPEAQPYYDLYVPDSDEEFEPASVSLSGMTGVERDSAGASTAAGAGPTFSVASDAGTAQQQEQQQEVEQQVGEEQLVQQQQAAVAAVAEGQQQAPQQEGMAAALEEQQQEGATAAAGTGMAVLEGVDSLDATAAAAAAAQETSSKSEETAVAEAGAEAEGGVPPQGLPHLKVGPPALGGRKENATDNSPRKRSCIKRGMAAAAAAAAADTAADAAPSADTAVAVA